MKLYAIELVEKNGGCYSRREFGNPGVVSGRVVTVTDPHELDYAIKWLEKCGYRPRITVFSDGKDN